MRRCGKACTCRSTFPVQPREEHRRKKVKLLQIPTKENGVQAMCSGATQPTFEEGRALSPATVFQQTTFDKGKEGSSTSCTLVQSVRLWASWEHKQRAKRRGPQQPSALAGRIWPQVIRSCKIAGRRKGEEEEEKGDYSTSSLLCWASTLR